MFLIAILILVSEWNLQVWLVTPLSQIDCAMLTNRKIVLHTREKPDNNKVNVNNNFKKSYSILL